MRVGREGGRTGGWGRAIGRGIVVAGGGGERRGRDGRDRSGGREGERRGVGRVGVGIVGEVGRAVNVRRGGKAVRRSGDRRGGGGV